MKTRGVLRWAALMVVVAACAALAWGKSHGGATPELSSAPAGEPVQKISAFQAAILGVVEGITEYLPVSSTGHMILTNNLMGMTHYTGEEGFFGQMLDKKKMVGVDSFEIVIQLGAILAVLGLYRKRVGEMLRGLLALTRRGSQPVESQDNIESPATNANSQGFRLLCLLIVAFLPAGITGLLFHKKIEEHLFGPIPVMWALLVGGVLMIVVEYFCWLRPRKIQRVTAVDKVAYWQALVIGMAQCLAMWPGTSRSMITILAGLVVGLDMMAAAEFSFLLALPTLGAATLYSAYKDWGALRESAGALSMVIGLVVSAVVAAIAVKAFVKWLTRHGLAPFGVYRILLAGAVYWFLMRLA